ncbi:NXPE family member 3-like [Rhinoderma darwinii]|uniref:NXPE family member 3-like n=1 Tax=Rhinoderma darwinii TaxID=43563 RepID=UPI003F671016
MEKYKPPAPKSHTLNMSTAHTTTASPGTINPKFKNLLKLIDWPGPPTSVRHFNFSTSPTKCTYYLLRPRKVYRIGEKLEVIITARDHNGQPKQYGGDYFRPKLHSPALKAGVTGRVKDYNNGSYLITFLLSWPGEAQVLIRLIHSSEAVDILKKKREDSPGKVFFNGYFQFNGSSEVMECNLKVLGNDVCTYKDPVSGDTWQCVRPRKLPCNSWVYHSMGGYRKVTNRLENSIMSGPFTNRIIPGSVPAINVKSDNSSMELTANLSACRPGQESPQPSGFYYGDRWTSFACLGRHFPQPVDALACLKGTDIYMVGDSTLRQWFEYLEQFISSLKRIDLHTSYKSGPLLATDADAGLVMRWRAHGLPLRTSKTLIADLHYEAADLAGIGGGPHTVIVMTLWAHFTTYPVRVYLERLERVRQAISFLLFRSPETTVIIKSANTGYKSIYGSDWLSLQLDILLRAAFKGMGVIILDAWDMTSCHYLPDNIHPGPPVIKNEVDLMLSYICPNMTDRTLLPYKPTYAAVLYVIRVCCTFELDLFEVFLTVCASRAFWSPEQTLMKRSYYENFCIVPYES